MAGQYTASVLFDILLLLLQLNPSTCGPAGFKVSYLTLRAEPDKFGTKEKKEKKDGKDLKILIILAL